MFCSMEKNRKLEEKVIVDFNNGLYRTWLDPLSATNLMLYEIISYKHSHFLILL